MQSMQEISHSSGHSYMDTSPHLKHQQVFRRLVSQLRSVMARYEKTSNFPHLLDVGAGDGAFVEPVLAGGWAVTALEMSRPAIDTLNTRYGSNPHFEALFDETEDLSPLGDRQFQVVLYASVVHHIPDYQQAIDQAISKHLVLGGSLITFQDPLWYPGLSRTIYYFSKLSYYVWRIFQGNLLQGLKTTLRRIRGVYDESNPSDMSEYHVVRSGVNQDQLVEMLRPRFDSVTVVPYWTAHSSVSQWIGERVGWKNTFAIVATGFKAKSRTVMQVDYHQ